jgi:starch phosphorylase
MEHENLKKEIYSNYKKLYGKDILKSSDFEMYCTIAYTIKEILNGLKAEKKQENGKKIYYMSMEFLLGRSLKNHLFNLGLLKKMTSILKGLNKDLDEVCKKEDDAGLGNGGLGRLAAAYLESLTNLGYDAEGFTLKYEYGLFKQKIDINGHQIELPDKWLLSGEVWLTPDEEDTYDVIFGGSLEKHWEGERLFVEYKNAKVIKAIPYDMNISGYNTENVNNIKLWQARASNDFDMKAFFEGHFNDSLKDKMEAESLCKLLYPADHHYEGKVLRLKQQYFFVSASIQYILGHHYKKYHTFDNLKDKIAIHINDTHPALCIPELIRIMMDDYGYSWKKAFDIASSTIYYTNHTVMQEALEKWNVDTFKSLLPRIYEIILEINKIYVEELREHYPEDIVYKNQIIADNQIKMANLCIVSSKYINGVSKLHSEILKDSIFNDYYKLHESKFKNVTNGITYRRWLCEANEELASYIETLIGKDYLKDASNLSLLLKYKDDEKVLTKLNKIKYNNKLRLAKYIKETLNIDVDPNSIFDCQIKRIHEYKRQLLNILYIMDLYYELKENPNLDIYPQTFIFSGKAAPSYHMAKEIIRLIVNMGNVINNDKEINGKIKVVFLENYRISLSELIIPASDISEQISVAGKEASGTGNMKFMLNGAVTCGTMDGANVEISNLVKSDNIYIFGHLANEVKELDIKGYNPLKYYDEDYRLRRIITNLKNGINGNRFEDIANNLITSDPYKVFLDFDSYVYIKRTIDKDYRNRLEFAKKSLVNIAKSSYFSSDRAISDYVKNIWKI